MKIAVLALQGAFAEHEKILNKLGVEYLEIRQASDALKTYDGIIIPGGESTVQGKLLHELDIYETIKKKIESGLPVFGTCAGLILLANKILNEKKNHLGTMGIEVVRNAYGRQLDSFKVKSNFIDIKIPMVFIRAPYISSVGEDCEILSIVDGKIVAAREKNQLVTAFHPELTNDLTVHKYFLSIVKEYLKNR